MKVVTCILACMCMIRYRDSLECLFINILEIYLVVQLLGYKIIFVLQEFGISQVWWLWMVSLEQWNLDKIVQNWAWNKSFHIQSFHGCFRQLLRYLVHEEKLKLLGFQPKWLTIPLASFFNWTSYWYDNAWEK
jgi:hypothetical protein